MKICNPVCSVGQQFVIFVFFKYTFVPRLIVQEYPEETEYS